MSIPFENVINITGHGMECGEDLQALGVISSSESTANIDFGKLHNIKSNTVIIQVRTKASDEVKHQLVSYRAEKIPRYTEKQIEYHLEVALDYANLWHKTFNVFVVRDIEFIFTLHIGTSIILANIPKKQAKRITKAAEQAVCGNPNAIQFLRIMTESFLLFESDEIIRRLRHSISVTPENFVLKEIYPTMQHMKILNTGYPVVLPGRVRVKLGCGTENRLPYTAR